MAYKIKLSTRDAINKEIEIEVESETPGGVDLMITKALQMRNELQK